MKKLIAAIALLALFSGLAFAQATNYQREADWITSTLDGATIDTAYTALPENRGKATFIYWVEVDSIKKSTAVDSINIWYRFAGLPGNKFIVGRHSPLYPDSTTNDTITDWSWTAAHGSSGTPHDWSVLKIHNGPDGALADFDSSAVILHGRRIPCVVDYDGYPYTYIQWKIHRMNAATSDCVRVKIWSDVD